MVTENAMTGSVKLYTDSDGMNFIADSRSGDVLTLQSGSVKGLIDVRDGPIKDLRDQLNTLASNLIAEVNALHQAGFDLSANNDSSLTFFTGTNAGDIGVNSTIISDPRKLQAASTGETGNNSVIRAMANMGDIAISGLSSMSFSEYYGNTVSRFGQDIALTDTQLIDQQAVQTMLEKQRDSVQGVSIDEEVANLIIYQRAFQASARLISTMDILMGDLLNLQR
jgi:flagellar hook-associated protein 1 FlgK